MRRHFILTSGRSGSNYLVNTLNQHPEIVNYGEVLGEWTIPYKLYRCMSWTGMRWRTYLNFLYDNVPLYYGAQAISALSHIRSNKRINFKRRKNLGSIGIKDFAFLLKDRGLLDYLTLSEDIEVIHLHRKNILKRYLSVLQLNKTGIALTSDNNVHHDRIHVNSEELIKSLDQYQAEKMLEMAILKSIPGKRCLTIYYEDYFQSDESVAHTNNMVLNFLGVDSLPVKSRQKKIGSDNLKEYIENYDEVCSILSGTPYESYLHD